MKIKSLQRAILLATGICAVVVILLSQSFYKTTDLVKSKAEKSKDKKEVVIHAPADVAAQGQSVELNEQQQSSLLEELVSSDSKNDKLIIVQKTTIKFLQTLFRAIISPNAP